MTDKLIESVALAIEAQLDKDFDMWLERWSNSGGLYIDAPDPPKKSDPATPGRLARAAILATLEGIREPSDGMLAACNGCDTPSGAALVDADNVAMWQAMIDTLIAELEPPCDT